MSYRKIEGVLQNELSEWAVERYGSSARKKARKDFEEGFETPPTVIDEESFLFETWFYYDWCPQGDPPLAMSYLKQHGDAVPTRARDLILATCAGHYSLHEVVDVQRGRGATLADLLTGKRRFVIDFNGSEYLKPSMVIMGRVIAIGGISMFMGLAAVPLSSSARLDAIRFRQSVEKEFEKATPETLANLADTIFDFYVHLEDVQSRPPQLVNFSREPIKLREIIYSHSDAEKVFDSLKDLYPYPEELEQNAERDDAGRLTDVAFPWVSTGRGPDKGMSLADVHITRDRMFVHVNSTARARRIKDRIKRRAGGLVRLVDETIMTPEKLMKEASQSPRLSPLDIHSHDDLMNHWRAFMEKHWAGWIHERLPALEGKTPAESVKTKQGRELVTAL